MHVFHMASERFDVLQDTDVPPDDDMAHLAKRFLLAFGLMLAAAKQVLIQGFVASEAHQNNSKRLDPRGFKKCSAGDHLHKRFKPYNSIELQRGNIRLQTIGCRKLCHFNPSNKGASCLTNLEPTSCP